MNKLLILKEFWNFLIERRKFLLIPIVLILVLLGALIVLTEGSVLAPFVYSFF